MTSDKQSKPQGLSAIPLEAIQAMSYKLDPDLFELADDFKVIIRQWRPDNLDCKSYV